MLRLVLRSCWALASSDEKNWIAGTPSAVEARWPSQWRRVIWPNGRGESDMGLLRRRPSPTVPCRPVSSQWIQE